MGSVLTRSFLRTIPNGVKSAQARLVLRCALLEAPIPALLQAPSLPTTDECLECIPDPQCRPFVSTVLRQLAARVTGDLFISSDDVATLSKAGLAAAKGVLLNLVPEFSAEITLPRAGIPYLRKRLAGHHLTPREMTDFQDVAPEVFELLECVYKVGNEAAELQMKSFFEGLAGIIEARELVTPPPWELIPETYNPPKRGIPLPPPPPPPPAPRTARRITVFHCATECALHYADLYLRSTLQCTQDLLSILLTRVCKGVIRGATRPDLTVRVQRIRALTSLWVDDGKLVEFLIGFVLMGSATVQV